MRTIKLTKGFKTVVDDEDYHFLNQWKWQASVTVDGEVYAKRKPCIYMHRLILHAKKGEQVDHRDRNSLNNQRFNLRLTTPSGNGGNTGHSKNNTSGFKGVTWHKTAKKWMAQIMVARKTHYLGLFDDPIVAAHRYDQEARIKFGDFATTNVDLGLLKR